MSEVLAQVLVRRGLGDPAAARAFLHPDFRVHDPYLMTGMAEARRRVDQALQRGEPIAVHGDYDADGITATFLLVSVLGELGADVRWRLPNRFSEGYGVSAAAVDELAAAGVKLLITVDCGINARAEVAQAQALGMDVIVTDHHELEGDLPACTVVTPKLGAYPCRAPRGRRRRLQAGARAARGARGRAASTCRSRCARTRTSWPSAPSPTWSRWSRRTACSPRIGLGRLRSAPRPGLAALLEVAGGTAGRASTPAPWASASAPRLNAAGRLEDASIALELLGAADRDAALPLALRLNELNRERQTIEAACSRRRSPWCPDPPPPALVLSSPDWHEGVVGIVASRVAERFHRPAILLSEGDDEAKGSGRSIPAFDLLGAVERTLGPPAHVRRASRRLRPAPAARRHPRLPRGVRRRGGGRARPRRPAAGARRGRHRRRRRAHARPRRRARAARAARLRQPPGDAAAARRRGGGAAPHARQAARPVPRALRRRLVPGHPLQLRRPRTSSREPGRHDVRAGARQERVQRLGERPGAGARPAPARAAGDATCAPPPATSAAATACAATACGRRCSATGVPPAAATAPPATRRAAALHAARAAGRLVDRRGRPPVSQLAALVAGGERVLVLVADVARRRPLLTRDVLAPRPALRGRLRAGRLRAAGSAAAAGAGVVMTDAGPRRWPIRRSRARSRTSSCSTRPSRGAAGRVSPPRRPRRGLHALWGAAEAGFAAPRPRDASSTWTRRCGASGGPSPPARAGLTMRSSRNSLGEEPCSRRSPPPRPRSRRSAKPACSSSTGRRLPSRTAAE